MKNIHTCLTRYDLQTLYHYITSSCFAKPEESTLKNYKCLTYLWFWLYHFLTPIAMIYRVSFLRPLRRLLCMSGGEWQIQMCESRARRNHDSTVVCTNRILEFIAQTDRYIQQSSRPMTFYEAEEPKHQTEQERLCSHNRWNSKHVSYSSGTASCHGHMSWSSICLWSQIITVPLLCQFIDISILILRCRKKPGRKKMPHPAYLWMQ